MFPAVAIRTWTSWRALCDPMNTAAIPTIPSTRITRRFAALRSEGQMGLVAFLTAGDPCCCGLYESPLPALAATESLVLALAEAGADGIELGVPFTDPV